LPEIEKLFIGIVRSKNQLNNLEDNPFPYELQEKMIKAVFPTDRVKIYPVKSAYLKSIMREFPGKVSYYLCGGDRVEEYQKQVDEFNDKKLNDAFKIKLITIDRPEDGSDVSASKVRKALITNDKKSFKLI
jgi:citrate lyase synthetase